MLLWNAGPAPKQNVNKTTFVQSTKNGSIMKWKSPLFGQNAWPELYYHLLSQKFDPTKSSQSNYFIKLKLNSSLLNCCFDVFCLFDVWEKVTNIFFAQLFPKQNDDFHSDSHPIETHGYTHDSLIMSSHFAKGPTKILPEKQFPPQGFLPRCTWPS